MTDLETRLRHAGEDLRLDRPVSDVLAHGNKLRRRHRIIGVSAASGALIAAAALAPVVATLGGGQQLSPADSTRRTSDASATAVPSSRPEVPKSAAQRAALADGEVTRAEYRAGFDRLVACMAARGAGLAAVDTTETVIDYSVMDRDLIAYDDCYAAEFKQLDIEWQVAHSEQSDGARHLRQCLRRLDLPPGRSIAERIEILESAGYSIADCD